MRTWQKSNSLRANRRWQSENKGGNFDIVKDFWHQTTASGSTWMSGQTVWYLDYDYGGVISSGSYSTGLYWRDSSLKGYYVNNTVAANSAYRRKAYLYNKVISGLGENGAPVKVTFTCLKTPSGVTTFRFCLLGAYLRYYTAENTYTTVGNTGLTFSDKTLTLTEGFPHRYYYEFSGEGDSITYTITPQDGAEYNCLILDTGGSNYLFTVGTPDEVTAGEWIWNITVSI